MTTGTVRSSTQPYPATRSEVIYAWQDDALCAQADPDAFFVNKGGNPKPAIKVCGDCPVAAQCLAFALSGTAELAGIWGGTTQRQRRKMRKEAAA